MIGMETKKCTKCNEIKLVSEFYKNKQGKFGVMSKCKVCQNEITKQRYQYNSESIKQRAKQWRKNNPNYMEQYRESLKNGKHHVYLLPEVNYIGITDNIKWRMGNHKSNNNISTTSSYKILHSFDNRDCALVVEDYYHELGWKGKHGEQNKNLLYAVQIN
jgi:hypothetical protein